MKRLFENSRGMTFVEIMASLIIAAILIWGLSMAYVHGLKRFEEVASEFQMINEGQIAIEHIEQLTRLASKVEVNESDEPLRSKLDLKFFDHRHDGQAGGQVNFYSNINDESLRMNYRIDDENLFNIRLLPRTTRKRSRRDVFGLYPYRVKLMSFRYGDDELEFDYNPDPLDQKYILMIDMILEDTLGNQVHLSSAQSKFNK
jgi:hypothetical protein